MHYLHQAILDPNHNSLPKQEATWH